jgi:hypothetical protein
MAEVERLHQQVANGPPSPETVGTPRSCTPNSPRLPKASPVAQQPQKHAKHLAEQNTKLMKVINAVASTA